MPAPIVIIGSVNMDLVCRTPRLPAPGETILGTDFLTIPGGKGANQAVAAARLGGDVHFVGRVGNDDFGRVLIDGLVREGVRTDRVGVADAERSGCAMILVDAAGENSIVVVPGANGAVTSADVDAAVPVLATAAAVVLQLEVPVGTVRHAVAVCRRLGTFTILDPAPVPPSGLPDDLYGVDLLTPNQAEARALLGWDAGRSADPAAVARALLERGAGSVVLKLGAAGALWASGGNVRHVDPFPVTAVDTTAAGDAFTAALAVGRAEGMDPAAAVRLANAAGALCCTAFGAQPSLPPRGAAEAMVAGRRPA